MIPIKPRTPQGKRDIMRSQLSDIDVANMNWRAKQTKFRGPQSCAYDKQPCHVMGGIGKGSWCLQCPRYLNSAKLAPCKFMLNEDAKKLAFGRLCKAGGSNDPRAMCHQCQYYKRAKHAKFQKSTKLEETEEWKRFDRKFDKGVDIKHLIETGKTRYIGNYDERRKLKSQKDKS